MILRHNSPRIMAQQDEIPQPIISTILRELFEIKALLSSKQAQENSKWLDESTTQEMLNIKATTLWKLRSEGFLKFSKVGRQTFYSRESIEKYIKENIR